MDLTWDLGQNVSHLDPCLDVPQVECILIVRKHLEEPVHNNPLSSHRVLQHLGALSGNLFKDRIIVLAD